MPKTKQDSHLSGVATPDPWPIRRLAQPDCVMDERHRLDTLHRAYTLALGSRHGDFLHSHLGRVHASGRRSSVLDVGTVSPRLWTQSIWAIELANAEPFADVLGVDDDWTAFGSGQHSLYGNIDFATVDVSRPLPWPRNSFDLIHVRCLALETPNFARLVERLAVTLRPGGLLVLVEAEYGIRSPSGSAPFGLVSWKTEVTATCATRGVRSNLSASLASCVMASGVFDPASVLTKVVDIPLNQYSTFADPLPEAGELRRKALVADRHRLLPELNANEGNGASIRLERPMNKGLHELHEPEASYSQKLVAVYAYKIG
ncbi:hypothetical protein IAU60_000813 [Kwoniella sp. DSM 27419]